jgi:hypothetical protein
LERSGANSSTAPGARWQLMTRSHEPCDIAVASTLRKASSGVVAGETVRSWRLHLRESSTIAPARAAVEFGRGEGRGGVISGRETMQGRTKWQALRVLVRLAHIQTIAEYHASGARERWKRKPCGCTRGVNGWTYSLGWASSIPAA